MAADNQGITTKVIYFYDLSKRFVATRWISCGEYAPASEVQDTAADNQGITTKVVNFYDLSKTFVATRWNSCGQYALANTAADNQGVTTKVVRFYDLSKTFVATRWLSCGQYALATKKYLSTSTRAGIIDLHAKKWLLRLDAPHPGMNKFHVNLNYQLTGFRDPHVSVPASVVKAGEAVTNARDVISTVALVAAVGIDAYNIHNAYQEDLKETNGIGKHTVKAGMSAAGTWVGAYVGSSAGSVTGTYVGGAVGCLFGGVGAVPGAAIGSLLMSAIGGYGGVVYGKAVAEGLVEETKFPVTCNL